MQALLEWEGRIGSVSRCRWCAASATFLLAVRVYSCAREKDGRLKGLCLLFYELGLYVWFLWGRALLVVPEPVSSVIPTQACTVVRAPLNPVLVACHRFKRIQVNPMCLPEILISEYARSWPACTDKPSLELNPHLWSLAATHRPSGLQRVTYATVPQGRAWSVGHLCF